MKLDQIQPGLIFHDGKAGVREVVEIHQPGRVTYRILAAKQDREYDSAKGEWVSIIGHTSKCDAASLAAWAKASVPVAEKEALLARLAAAKLKLAPGETSFMKAILSAFAAPDAIKNGVSVPFGFADTRSARGIEKKGLGVLERNAVGGGGRLVLNELGAAWSRLNFSGV